MRLPGSSAVLQICTVPESQSTVEFMCHIVTSYRTAKPLILTVNHLCRPEACAHLY
uniref:Uncharacterized protein n=1 Tax=Anguilla anguilla TaxID=7936 RepID=A0A0E9QZ17_ANGAN